MARFTFIVLLVTMLGIAFSAGNVLVRHKRQFAVTLPARLPSGNGGFGGNFGNFGNFGGFGSGGFGGFGNGGFGGFNSGGFQGIMPVATVPIVNRPAGGQLRG